MNEIVPANVGITSECMSEIHTHDASGEIHIESAIQGRTFTISDFFAVWGRSIDRDGYTYTMKVNGNDVDATTYELKDAEQIEIAYTTIGNTPVEADQVGGFKLKI